MHDTGTDLLVADAPASPPAALPVTRRLIFISHATPQDNAFATWLSTQLVIAGYEVWCDVTQLLGGERFWNDIGEAIDAYAFRVLFVSTLEANRKPGTVRELDLALAAQKTHGLKDFVVPLKVDQFPFSAMRPPLADLNCVRFDANWAAGLRQLLDLLEREGAPKSPLAGPACVSQWHLRSRDRRRQVVVSDERCHSNWFRLRLPATLHFHSYAGPADALDRIAAGFPFPHRVHAGALVTFAGPADLAAHLDGRGGFPSSVTVEPKTFIAEGDDRLGVAPFDAANIVSDLVRQSWEAAMDAQGLSAFTLASGLAARFFRRGQLEKDRAYYKALGGRRAYRQVVGAKSRKTATGEKVPDGFWHYALSASPQLVPYPRLALRHHVLFTDDGTTPWEKADRMHKARRSVCKQWWNREWRDRLFAFTAELAKGQTELRLPVGEAAFIAVSMVPMTFIAPWTYFEDAEEGLDETTEIELVEEDEDEEGDDNGKTP